MDLELEHDSVINRFGLESGAIPAEGRLDIEEKVIYQAPPAPEAIATPSPAAV